MTRSVILSSTLPSIPLRPCLRLCDNDLCEASDAGQLVDLNAPILKRAENLFWVNDREIGLAYEGDLLKDKTREAMTRLDMSAISLVRDLAFEFAKHCPEADLKITSLVRSAEYQRLLAHAEPNATIYKSSHSTGLSFDVGFGGFVYNKDGSAVADEKLLQVLGRRVKDLESATEGLLNERKDFIYYREDRCMHFCLLPEKIAI